MKSLHELSEEYTQKIIDKDTYRNSRRELIKKICSGQITLDAYEYLAPLPLITERENDYNETTHVLSETKATPKKKVPQLTQTTRPLPKFLRKKIVIGTATIALLCACIIVLIAYSPIDKFDNAVGTPDQQITAQLQWKTLINDFIKNKNWQQSNMESFLALWQQLSEQELAAAAGSPEMKRIANAIYQRLLEKRALLNLHDNLDKIVADQKALVDFATKLGIVDKRFTVVDR